MICDVGVVRVKGRHGGGNKGNFESGQNKTIRYDTKDEIYDPVAGSL